MPKVGYGTFDLCGSCLAKVGLKHDGVVTNRLCDSCNYWYCSYCHVADGENLLKVYTFRYDEKYEPKNGYMVHQRCRYCTVCEKVDDDEYIDNVLQFSVGSEFTSRVHKKCIHKLRCGVADTYGSKGYSKTCGKEQLTPYQDIDGKNYVMHKDCHWCRYCKKPIENQLSVFRPYKTCIGEGCGYGTAPGIFHQECYTLWKISYHGY